MANGVMEVLTDDAIAVDAWHQAEHGAAVFSDMGCDTHIENCDEYTPFIEVETNE